MKFPPMNQSIKLAIASILVGTIGMASIPASYASSAISSGHKATVGAAGHSTLTAKATPKAKAKVKAKVKAKAKATGVKKVSTMKKP